MLKINAMAPFRKLIYLTTLVHFSISIILLYSYRVGRLQWDHFCFLMTPRNSGRFFIIFGTEHR